METIFHVVMIAVGLIFIAGVTFLATIFCLGILRGQVFYGGRFWDQDVFLDAMGSIKKESDDSSSSMQATAKPAATGGRRASDRLYSVDLGVR